ncbi:hypothetical protein LZG74_16850 [Dyadobacter sp. CY327]|uniref:hypothetical protein n=1 Tax=Dyadobacter sp. CY327 TaxID=2907301 RepID=UPI001F20F631|nr:hypothetical protein [Dyadobacter sp. CY327]MCE7071987.1 hypothetical protein [Dyadobacter sp. CY327]
MSDKVGGANVKIGGDASGLISELNAARQRFALFTRELNTNVTQAYKRADAGRKVFGAGLTRLGDEVSSLGQKMLVFGALPTLFAAGKAYKDYTEIQRMEKGLSLYGETLEDIRRLAKEPNIGVFDGAKSLVGLRAVRIESELAERAVKAFANAIAGAGGNQADLEPALFNLKQFKGTQNINTVDLRQLANRIPQTMEVLEKAFKTTDPEKLNKLGIDRFIEGFVTELEKLPKVTGLAAVATEQLGDSFTFTSATFGEGAEKAFDVSSRLLALGATLDDLSTNFRTLNPEGQKTVLMLGGLAVAVPLITVALGTLIKLLPITAAGFAGISWPVVAIIATGAALTALIALWPLLNNKAAEFNSQQELMTSFTTKLNPLVAKYQELTSNAKLSGEQQKELKKVTAEIAKIVPDAATGFDKYGNAIDINIDKVRTFIGEQKRLYEALAKTRKEAISADISANTTRIKGLSNQLKEGITYEANQSGVAVKRSLSAEEKKALRDQVKQARDEIQKARYDLQGVEGIDSIADRRIGRYGSKEEKPLKKKEDDAKGAKGAIKDLTEAELQLWNIDITMRAAEQQKALKDKVQAYKELFGVTANLSTSLLAISKVTLPNNIIGSTAYDTKQRAKTKTDGLAETRMPETIRAIVEPIKEAREQFEELKNLFSAGWSDSDILKFMDSLPKVAGQSFEQFKEQVDKSAETLESLNQALTGALQGAITDSAVGFGELLGNLASGVGGIDDFGKKLIGSLANMLKEMGKAMIAAGVSAIALKKLMKVPALAVAAGIALVAVGQTLNNSVTKSVNKTSTTRFAKGGLAYREMPAIVGDNPNARFDPEMIAPYSKIHSSIQKSVKEAGQGNNNTGGFIAETRIAGGDLLLVIEKAQAVRKNLKGY